ncbi:MAG: hypothetical protein PHP41_01845 [Bacilli bacterium]|jgi:hypothetical protein|nr:hypothetical protein [Bacilli bacterium]MDY0063973.1 hypothetical protein [Bacilli bacterium]
MRFRDYFSNDFETSEMHEIPSLRSRYYRCKKEEAMEAVKKVAVQMKTIVRYIDNERFEIIFESPVFSATATIISTHFTETAVDFKVTTYSLLPLLKGKKIIEELYRHLDKLIPFKDVGLYRGR